MTRKDYIAIADIAIADILSKHQVSNNLIIELSEHFKLDNPRFDASTFIYYYQDKKTKFQNKQNENGNKSKFGKEAIKEFVENNSKFLIPVEKIFPPLKKKGKQCQI